MNGDELEKQLAQGAQLALHELHHVVTTVESAIQQIKIIESTYTKNAEVAMDIADYANTCVKNTSFYSTNTLAYLEDVKTLEYLANEVNKYT